MKKEEFSLWKLFYSMLVISACTFGGGFVMIGMMKKKYCEQWHWVDDDEVLDMVAIAQSAPGAMAVNSSIIFGYRMKGVIGALVAVLGVMIPPLCIITVVALFYNQFRSIRIVQIALQVMRAGVAAIILDVVVDLAKDVRSRKNVWDVIFMIGAFIASMFFDASAVGLILIFIAIGIGRVLMDRKKEEPSC